MENIKLEMNAHTPDSFYDRAYSLQELLPGINKRIIDGFGYQVEYYARSLENPSGIVKCLGEDVLENLSKIHKKFKGNLFGIAIDTISSCP